MIKRYSMALLLMLSPLVLSGICTNATHLRNLKKRGTTYKCHTRPLEYYQSGNKKGLKLYNGSTCRKCGCDSSDHKEAQS